MGANQNEGPKELVPDNRMMAIYDPKSTEPFLIFSWLSPAEFSDRLISKLSDEEVKA